MKFSISKENITGAATGILIDIGKELIAAIAPELYPLLMEWWKERDTPDGWSKKERLPYLYAMVSRVKAKQIGPSWFDYLGDFALQAILRELSKDMDAAEPVPVDDPTNPHPEPKPVVKPYYGKLFVKKPDAAEYNVDGDKLWWNQATINLAIRYTITDAAAVIAYPGWAQIDW